MLHKGSNSGINFQNEFTVIWTVQVCETGSSKNSLYLYKGLKGGTRILIASCTNVMRFDVNTEILSQTKHTIAAQLRIGDEGKSRLCANLKKSCKNVQNIIELPSRKH